MEIAEVGPCCKDQILIYNLDLENSIVDLLNHLYVLFIDWLIAW